ncbi:MAG TPA: YkvA family protein [Candidatus Dormibacteraeota bacterium]|jgi:uncharacterized membrane protein YkvA (DUF1232 family)
MNLSLSHVRTILAEVPMHAKLAYCLLRDDRVPMAPKAAVLGALGLIVSPIDLPAWIPVIGELDMLALGILAVKTFVDACPEEVVADNRAAIRARTSAWDRDRTAGAGMARESLDRLVQNWRSRLPKAG